MTQYVLEYEVVAEQFLQGTFQFEGRRVKITSDLGTDGEDILSGKRIPKSLEERFPGGLITLVSYKEIRS